MRIVLIVVAFVSALALGVVLWLRPLAEGPPVMVLEHEIEIEGTLEQVWNVFMDADRLGEWNPYLLEVTGEVRVGGEIEILIVQDNWDEPMRLAETVMALDPPNGFHWRGSMPPTGLFVTDHSFRLEALAPERVRFVHREEFRGWLAGLLDADEEGKAATLRAFRGMDEALAARVAAEREGSSK